ncbi:hypothetical protein B566_EDAN013785 [Ephemera danica]|nr:hypothetical protein B566_EDAN013785 [Ephemera danica]
MPSPSRSASLIMSSTSSSLSFSPRNSLNSMVPLPSWSTSFTMSLSSVSAHKTFHSPVKKFYVQHKELKWLFAELEMRQNPDSNHSCIVNSPDGRCPRERMTTPSSAMVMVPSSSLSNSMKASLNSAKIFDSRLTVSSELTGAKTTPWKSLCTQMLKVLHRGGVQVTTSKFTLSHRPDGHMRHETDGDLQNKATMRDKKLTSYLILGESVLGLKSNQQSGGGTCLIADTKIVVPLVPGKRVLDHVFRDTLVISDVLRTVAQKEANPQVSIVLLYI